MLTSVPLVMRIRPLRPRDLHYFNIPAFPLDTRTWVLETHAPIAYAGYSVTPGLPHLADLYIYVMPAHRRRGYGTRLLNYVIERVDDDSLNTLSSPVDHMRTPTALFMQHHGFRVEHIEVELICDLRNELDAEATDQLTVGNDEAAANLMRRLYDESFRNLPWFQPYADADEVLDDMGDSGEILTMHVDGEPVGFVGVRYERGVADIEPLGVVQARQGQGFGRRLLASTLTYLQHRGCHAAQLAVWENNEAALNLYHKFGFQFKNKRIFLALKFR